MVEGTGNGRFVILVVEDDAAVRNLLTMTLDLQGYRVEYADRGSAGLMAAASLNPDLLILDLGLPDMDGSGVIGKIRSWSDVPILVVSARLEDADKVAALDAGADDYIFRSTNCLRAFAWRFVALSVRVIRHPRSHACTTTAGCTSISLRHA